MLSYQLHKAQIVNSISQSIIIESTTETATSITLHVLLYLKQKTATEEYLYSNTTEQTCFLIKTAKHFARCNRHIQILKVIYIL